MNNMDYKYIEQLLERYFNAESTLEEESILRTFFSQEYIPAELEQWRPLFTADRDEQLGDDFDARILEAIAADDKPVVKARKVTLAQRLSPLFKAAAVIAIFLTIGGALQAPWDNNWNGPVDYAGLQYQPDSVEVVSPVRAENVSETVVDSSKVLPPVLPKD